MTTYSDIGDINLTRESKYAMLDVVLKRLIAEQKRCKATRERFMPEKIIRRTRMEVSQGKL